MELFALGRCKLQGNRATLGKTKETNFLREEVFLANLFCKVEEEGDLIFPKSGLLVRMLTMAWQVRDDASEAGCAKTLCYGEMMFFPTAMSMKEEESGRLLGKWYLSVRELLSKKKPFRSDLRCSFTEIIRRAIGGGMGAQLHPVFGGIGHDVVVPVV